MENSTSFYESYRDSTALYVSYAVNTQCKAHFHKSIELIYIIDGSFNLFTRGLFFQPKSDQIVFIPSMYTHQITTLGSKSISLVIPENYTFLFSQITKKKSFPTILDDCEFNRTHLFGEFEKLLDYEQYNSLLLNGRINTLLGYLLQNYSLSQDYGETHNSNIVFRIINYLNEHFRQDVTLEKIAEDFHYNKYYFSKLFSKHFHCTLKSYLNTLRIMDVASQIVQCGETSSQAPNITQLAYDAGFNSISSFYRNFEAVFRPTLITTLSGIFPS